MTVPVLHHTEYETRLGAYAVIVDDRDHVLLALWNEADDEARWFPVAEVPLLDHVDLVDVGLRFRTADAVRADPIA